MTTSRTRCRRCDGPRPVWYVGVTCPTCEYEKSVGRIFARLRPPSRDGAEQLRLLEVERSPVRPQGAVQAELYREANEAA